MAWPAWLLQGLDFGVAPRPVFKREDDNLCRATRDWSGQHVEARLPAKLGRFFEALLARPADAEVLIGRLRNWEKVSGRVEAHGLPLVEKSSVIAEVSTSRALGGHLGARPAGVGFEAAIGKSGGLGAWDDRAGVRRRVHVVDIELGANLDHIEFAGRVTELGLKSTDVGHGTAVLGILAPDGRGRVQGLVPEAQIAIAPTPAKENSTSAEERILWYVAANCPPGSVILLERVVPRFLRYYGGAPQYTHPLPLEAFDSAREAIAAVVDDLKISVVECAGNAAQPIDSELGADCGAILVGMSNPTNGTRGSSNYGQRVHLHSWGRDVLTCGDLNGCYYPPQPHELNECYTYFDGTSCAGAIVAGVVAAATGLLSAAQMPVDPRRLREMLVDSGYYQTDSIENGKIGRHPDLKEFISRNRL